ncbi:hypothetical protein M5585_13860 [Serratia ureilytica]
MTLWHYFRARRLRFGDRAALEAHQARQLAGFARRVLSKSPYFQRFSRRPFAEWPQMDKALMMAQFDRMNTAGLSREAVLACAQRSEADRDFTPKIGRYSVGLSSGTSGQRGVFVVSPREQQVWAGGMLAKMLPDGLLAGERVALFLRADNNLYHSVNNRWLSLAFTICWRRSASICPRWNGRCPASSWRRRRCCAPGAGGAGRAGEAAGQKVISVAEVLEEQDRRLLMQVFPAVGEVYQATEGFLAATCAHGCI